MQVLFKHLSKNQCFYQFGSKIAIPQRIGVLGYGAIGRSTIELILKDYPNANIIVLEKEESYLPRNETRFQHLLHKVTRDNIQNLLNVMKLKEGDFLIDVSTNVNFMEIWPLCLKNGVRYLNTALEVWPQDENMKSYPQTQQELYNCCLVSARDEAKRSSFYNPNSGTTCILDMGMNPGLVQAYVQRALEDAGKHILQNDKIADVDKKQLQQHLADKNHKKLAQTLGVHTIHCSETDNQVLSSLPKDFGKKFYNTWSCRGFLTEGLVPVQAAMGSHEDKNIEKFTRLTASNTLMSHCPSVQVWAKSWVPNQDIKGVLIPHGEAFSINEYLHDPETGYSPSQYYVYDINTYAKCFVMNLPKTATIENTFPDTEVMHPVNHPSLRGIDKVGALLLMKNNRGWWTGSVMDDVDCRDQFNHQFGPTVLQVAAGVYAGFLYGCANPNVGTRFADTTDSSFLIEKSRPYTGRFVSTSVDLNETHIKDCHKFQSYLTTPPPIPKV